MEPSVIIEASVPLAVNREGRFSKTDFAWDWEVDTVTCLQGQVRPIPPLDPKQAREKGGHPVSPEHVCAMPLACAVVDLSVAGQVTS